MNEEEKKPIEQSKNVKVLRTYTSDMAEAVRENEVSVIKIAMAEKERRDMESEYKKAKGTSLSKILLVIGGIALIAISIWGVSYIIRKKKIVLIPPASIIETFIPYDSGTEIDVTDATNTSKLTSIVKKGQLSNPGMIEALFLVKKTNNTSQAMTSSDFLSIIQTTMPPALIRSLSPKFLLGKYTNANASDIKNKFGTFLFFETTDYSQAYASMLEWEGTMVEDLFTLFNIPKPSNALSIKPWNDIIVNNKDTRVIYGEDGQPIIYYSFVNKNDFVITDNIEALNEVISRIITKNK
jgi:hypothetical protein